MTSYADGLMSQYGSATWHWVIWELPLSTGLRLWSAILKRMGSEDDEFSEHEKMRQVAIAAEKVRG